MIIDVVEIWFRLANGQIYCLSHDCGGYYRSKFFFFFFFFLLFIFSLFFSLFSLFSLFFVLFCVWYVYDDALITEKPYVDPAIMCCW